MNGNKAPLSQKRFMDALADNADDRCPPATQERPLVAAWLSVCLSVASVSVVNISDPQWRNNFPLTTQ